MSTKSKRTVKVRTVKNRIIKEKKIKGVKYTVEPLTAKTRDPTVKGDIFKKYVNGVLVKQVFVSKNKLKELLGKMKKKFSKSMGGATRKKQPKEVQQIVVQQGQITPQQVEMSDKTTFGQTLKSGFGSGLGLGLGFEIINSIFND
jgi:hypothetical protein